ncbi:hypothetical protein A143_11740 [Vibrio splendidus ZS-139]|nr:hypothetical protein A143_11740 [Vibrio splendidus ZS-139]
MKPKIFVASSVEGLDVAYSVQVNLQHDADVTVWPQGVFSLSETPLDSITKALSASDFGIFVFSSDDMLKMRDTEHNAVRDNVLFELGLFVGRLGKQRCFIIMPDNPELHIPSDLIGVTPAKYSSERPSDELAAALGPACHDIRKAIRTLGLYKGEANQSKIPANEYDSYDESDKMIILEAWLVSDHGCEDLAMKYIDIDNELKLEPGTTKKFLPAIINRTKNYSMVSNGSNIFRFTYESSYY